MVFKRNSIFKMVLKSLWITPGDWECETHGVDIHFFTNIYWLINNDLDLKIWTANGLTFFKLENGKGIRVRLSFLQSLILHIAYLRKVRKYPYIFILIRYILTSIITILIISPLIHYLESYSDKKELYLSIEKSKRRSMILDEILD
jgi:hypothetical protein